MKEPRLIIHRALLTEKGAQQREQANQFIFEVAMDANKIEIRDAIQARYPGVKIKEVRTMVVRGKRRRQFTRRGLVEGRVSSFKKAIVTLQPDSEQIDFFEEV